MNVLADLKLARAPHFKLGSREFAVPSLPLEYAIEIDAVMREVGNFDLQRMTGRDIEILSEIVLLGISRASPEMTRDLFWSLPISLIEIIGAWRVVMEQAGFEMSSKAATEGTARRRPKVGWDQLIADICASTGWTWDEVLARSLRELGAMRQRWLQCPPGDRLLAAFVGYKPPPEEISIANYAEAAAENADWFKDPMRFFKK